MHKYVYLFSEGNGSMRELLGGKGANLAEMTNLGMPVPQGFTISTEACTKYYEDDRNINDEIKAQVYEALARIEKINGKKFGDAKNPLLVSVRSGARASMPGMMDTILNLGLNDEDVYKRQVRFHGSLYDLRVPSRDCHVASLLAMTIWGHLPFQRWSVRFAGAVPGTAVRSPATVSYTHLALRLAMCRRLLPPDAPMVLDDALVNFDPARTRAALRVLREEPRQILLFTCRPLTQEEEE